MDLLALAEKILNGYFAATPRKKPNIADINEVRLIAHRGAHNNPAGIFENTMEAFRLAKKAGCWGIELDVHVTADNVLVVNHDPTLNRLWRQNVAINDLTFSAIRSLAPQIPSLAEVIAEFGGQMHLLIELKNPLQDEAILVQTLQHLSPVTDYHLLTLTPEIFNSLTQFPHKSLLLVPVHNNVKAFCDLSIKNNYGGVMGSYLLLTNERIRQLTEAYQVLGVGFVDSKNSLWREINRGVKWIFTNQAVVVAHYLHLLKHR
ncbi:glycerophosphodiester phosphodiesterase [Legionella fallonii]|uniref:Glycerophosphoryl diester phosphodiesterase n=1 Tax=Legionella fallonii LLAP-10 TaxID=1212491 RepID=A0A098G9C4_9GAMM|nr:glycerophosphodiester phosphodiesterase family protein [Legionella fallonii]CEG59068.1 Glycerophosphoryl diester phosphodiesterase [Legionella fallonii LLAP-10]